MRNVTLTKGQSQAFQLDGHDRKSAPTALANVTIHNSAPNVVAAAILGNELTLAEVGPGTAQVVLAGTVDGAGFTETFHVTVPFTPVVAPSPAPKVTITAKPVITKTVLPGPPIAEVVEG